MSNAQLLESKAATLPEPIAAEVLDFLEFVLARRKDLARHESASEVRRDTVHRLRGSMKGQLSSTQEFLFRKADEIRLEDSFALRSSGYVQDPLPYFNSRLCRPGVCPTKTGPFGYL